MCEGRRTAIRFTMYRISGVCSSTICSFRCGRDLGVLLLGLAEQGFHRSFSFVLHVRSRRTRRGGRRRCRPGCVRAAGEKHGHVPSTRPTRRHQAAPRVRRRAARATARSSARKSRRDSRFGADGAASGARIRARRGCRRAAAVGRRRRAGSVGEPTLACASASYETVSWAASERPGPGRRPSAGGSSPFFLIFSSSVVRFRPSSCAARFLFQLGLLERLQDQVGLEVVDHVAEARARSAGSCGTATADGRRRARRRSGRSLDARSRPRRTGTTRRSIRFSSSRTLPGPVVAAQPLQRLVR